MEIEAEIPRPDTDEEDNMQLFDEEDEPGNPMDEAQEVPDSSENAGEPKVIKPKKVIKNPQPKLDEIRLMGPRGITILQNTFKDIKFKGKGYEKEDLKLLIKNLEHWAHRLFPKSTFDDNLKQIEKLGSKKSVQNMMKRIRLDMFQSDEFSTNDNRDVDNIESNDAPPEIDVFDELLSTGPFFEKNSETGVDKNLTPILQNSQSSKLLNLTDEQRERMERNRLLAIERRKSKFEQKNEDATLSQTTLNFPVESSIDPNNMSFKDTKDGNTEESEKLISENSARQSNSTSSSLSEKTHFSTEIVPKDKNNKNNVELNGINMVTEDDLLGLI